MDGSGSLVAVRVKPGSSRTRVGGRYDGPHGAALIVAVHAPPVDGRATDAAIAALADALGLRRATLSLRSGATGRDKIIAVTDAPPDLADRVARLRDAPP
ncbi:DUF167 domain-containing protein [Virgisporangium aurantiacum]|uniref:UPF0235 protein Vau01_059170 n=1 Tax=Virgisporangium aurantiacum TaxID=175570 RepID=A0A8J3ZB06_9ACTN|nr:DUF167 domain-containing protein [Virgisporangium aurantiacum]GIJ58401.1 hypothetical protein Vau01_059170 [Virgisporangium aurantiacum]